MEFKDRLKQLRKEKSISVIKLKGMLNKQESTIRMWENGNSSPDNKTLIKLSEIFNVSTDYLLGLSDYKSEQNASIGEMTGLSDSTLKSLYDNKIFMPEINAFLSNKNIKELLSVLAVYLSPDSSKAFGDNLVSELKKNDSFYRDLKDVSFDYDSILLNQVLNIAEKIFEDMKEGNSNE